MPTLALNDLTVRRGPNPVVTGLDLRIQAGRPFWVVGPNGAGKTSLLRVVARLDSPVSGTVAREPGNEPFRYFHSEMRLPGWSVVGAWDRLVVGLDPRIGPPTALRPAVSPDRWVRLLSTGERKRLLLDALLRVPGSLLLDEPYEHLSPDAKQTLSTLLRERARNAVVVVVTNQAVHRAPSEPGIRIEAGIARSLGANPRPAPTGTPGPTDPDPHAADPSRPGGGGAP